MTRLSTSPVAAIAAVAIFAAVETATAQPHAPLLPPPETLATWARTTPVTRDTRIDAPPVTVQSPPAPAARTRRSRKWSVEVHGGRFGELIDAGASRSAAIEAFPAGAPFTTMAGGPSRAVASWLYGDGTVLFDQIRASFASTYGVNLSSITPLDDVLRSSGTTRTFGTTVGGRFSRDITSWLGLEVAYDRGPSETAVDEAVFRGVEATRSSYVAAFQSLLATIPQDNGVVTATVTSTDVEASRHQQIATASLVLTPIRISRFGLHLSAGGGIVKNDVSPTEIRLQAGYRFSLLSQFPINESETVTIRFSEKSQVPVWVAGAGFTLDLWGPLGVRADARVLAMENAVQTTVSSSGTHVTTPAAAQQVTLPSLTSPSIQFSSIPGVQTTLGGGTVNDLVTYSGSGYQVRPHITVGLVLRF